MTEAEERQKRALALLDYHDARQAVALLQIEARQVAEDLEGLAKSLRDAPDRIDNPNGKLATYREIFDLAARLNKAVDTLGIRQKAVQKLGYDV